MMLEHRTQKSGKYEVLSAFAGSEGSIDRYVCCKKTFVYNNSIPFLVQIDNVFSKSGNRYRGVYEDGGIVVFFL